jgi:hypothetical protein
VALDAPVTTPTAAVSRQPTASAVNGQRRREATVGVAADGDHGAGGGHGGGPSGGGPSGGEDGGCQSMEA